MSDHKPPEIRIRVDVDGRTVDDRIVTPKPPCEPIPVVGWRRWLQVGLAVLMVTLGTLAFLLPRGEYTMFLVIGAFGAFLFAYSNATHWVAGYK